MMTPEKRWDVFWNSDKGTIEQRFLTQVKEAVACAQEESNKHWAKMRDISADNARREENEACAKLADTLVAPQLADCLGSRIRARVASPKLPRPMWCEHIQPHEVTGNWWWMGTTAAFGTCARHSMRFCPTCGTKRPEGI